MKIWYKTIIERKLTYAKPIWLPKLQSSYGLRLLNSIQRSSYLLIPKADKKDIYVGTLCFFVCSKILNCYTENKNRNWEFSLPGRTPRNSSPGHNLSRLKRFFYTETACQVYKHWKHRFHTYIGPMLGCSFTLMEISFIFRQPFRFTSIRKHTFHMYIGPLHQWVSPSKLEDLKKKN